MGLKRTSTPSSRSSLIRRRCLLSTAVMLLLLTQPSPVHNRALPSVSTAKNEVTNNMKSQFLVRNRVYLSASGPSKKGPGH
ncbi:hypothetical protein Acr_09g0002160 [Actinidia rufa]|uniref:Uncharacterized protein n=1 Tax=Actinidia rufa TaxID=165716 RepID=A0A7J0F512_9ERIC|nr:hypothetical protein Acr_09g0002160 [Actinidia rufa]